MPELGWESEWLMASSNGSAKHTELKRTKQSFSRTHRLPLPDSLPAGAICVDFRSLVPARGIPRTKRSPNPKTAQKAAAASKERCVESPAGCRCRPRRPRKGDLASAVLLFPGSLK